MSIICVYFHCWCFIYLAFCCVLFYPVLSICLYMCVSVCFHFIFFFLSQNKKLSFHSSLIENQYVHVLFIYCLFICWRSNYQEGLLIPSIGLNLPHFCVCPNPEPGFPTKYVLVFFVQWLR